MNWIKFEEIATQMAAGRSPSLSQRAVATMFETGLLPEYNRGGERFVLRDDLESLRPMFEAMMAAPSSIRRSEPLANEGGLRAFPLSPSTQLYLDRNPHELPPTFFSAGRALVGLSGVEPSETSNVPYIGGSVLVATNGGAVRLATDQVERIERVERSRGSMFANSAYYMGSKRNLAGMITEALAQHLPAEGRVLDLMCGSGAVSGASAQVWRTTASDALEFCRALAVVQGGGMTAIGARGALGKVLATAREHLGMVAEGYEELFDREDKLFHADPSEAVRQDFLAFRAKLPSVQAQVTGREPAELILRKGNHHASPYLLFVLYYSGIYFGLRQCAEIDSLRWAVDQIADPMIRQWAIGSLVAAVSGVATTYGGHFAQPPREALGTTSTKRMAEWLDCCSRSVLHEFAVRFISLAEESAGCRYPVETIAGPWREALVGAASQWTNEPVAVYLDAPYNRDEYSRYYHVLESLVKYDYPSATGAGRTPDKRKGERFSSEFATRRRENIVAACSDAISSVVDKGWACAWSYADTGHAGIHDVLDSVAQGRRLRVQSYSAAYRHVGQGGRGPRRVTEYVIVFVPI